MRDGDVRPLPRLRDPTPTRSLHHAQVSALMSGEEGRHRSFGGVADLWCAVMRRVGAKERKGEERVKFRVRARVQVRFWVKIED